MMIEIVSWCISNIGWDGATAIGTIGAVLCSLYFSNKGNKIECDIQLKVFPKDDRMALIVANISPFVVIGISEIFVIRETGKKEAIGYDENLPSYLKPGEFYRYCIDARSFSCILAFSDSKGKHDPDVLSHINIEVNLTNKKKFIFTIPVHMQRYITGRVMSSIVAFKEREGKEKEL
jgi:hypothetical protein